MKGPAEEGGGAAAQLQSPLPQLAALADPSVAVHTAQVELSQLESRLRLLISNRQNSFSASSSSSF